MDTRKIKVVLPCTLETVDRADVEVEDVSEDAQGRIVLTFHCPVCAEYHKSYMIRS